MKIDLTRWRTPARPPFYTRNAEKAGQDIQLDTTIDCQDIAELIEQQERVKLASRPRAWGFGRWLTADAGNCAATWIAASAVVLEYAIEIVDNDAQAQFAYDHLQEVAAKLDQGFWTIYTSDRKHLGTMSVVWPLREEVVSAAQYARLAAVLRDQMLDLGCQLQLVPGSIAATHLIHTHTYTTAVYHQAPVLDAKMKIKETSSGYKQLDKDRGTVGFEAAQVHISRSDLVCDDDLFKW